MNLVCNAEEFQAICGHAMMYPKFLCPIGSRMYDEGQEKLREIMGPEVFEEGQRYTREGKWPHIVMEGDVN